MFLCNCFVWNIDYIFKHHDNKIARILLTGSTGVGKSFIAKLLAQKYNSSFCFEIKLNDPGVDLRELYSTAEVDSYKKPLILLIDEFDILIENIHHQKIMKLEHLNLDRQRILLDY